VAEWLNILDGGRLLYEPHFYAREEADALFDWLMNKVPWRQETARGGPLPRLNAWFADEGLRYNYSGISHVGTGWLPELAAIKQKVEAASGAVFNSLLLNLYRDGQDSIGFHSDAEPELGRDPVVATLSFGAEWDFVLKHKVSRKAITYRLAHGSLLVMGGSSQHHWLHGLPKTSADVGKRVSLTFRRIVG